MTYGEAAQNLLECVEEYAVIYHKLQILEVCMYIAWFFFFVSLYMVVRYMFLPSVKGALDNIERSISTDNEKNCRYPYTNTNPNPNPNPQPKPDRRYDIEDLLKEFENA